MGKREEAYDNEIAPLMTKVIEACKAHDIPMLATFQYTEPDCEDGYCTTIIPASSEGEGLTRLKRTWQSMCLGHSAIAITEVTDGSHTTISVRRV